MIHVYCVQTDSRNIDDSALLSRIPSFIEELPAVKRERILHIRPSQGRINSALGWRLLQFALRDCGYTGFALSQLFFDANRKPRWPRNTCDFNLTHADTLVACAITDAGRVGVDCERVRTVQTTGLLRRILSPREHAPPDIDILEFFRIWTQKEAVIKAEGNGGVWDMSRVQLDGPNAYYKDARWYVYPVTLADQYVAHVASDTPGRLTTVREVTIEQLLRNGGPLDRRPQMA
jgi:4'-phosphopantetheinyl transferase